MIKCLKIQSSVFSSYFFFKKGKTTGVLEDSLNYGKNSF